MRQQLTVYIIFQPSKNLASFKDSILGKISNIGMFRQCRPQTELFIVISNKLTTERSQYDDDNKQLSAKDRNDFVENLATFRPKGPQLNGLRYSAPSFLARAEMRATGRHVPSCPVAVLIPFLTVVC